VPGTSPLHRRCPITYWRMQSFSTQKDHKQTLLAARVAVEENGCCPGPGRTRRSPLRGGDR
ncbi:hypothetical protein NDU88_003499, partial [Pleurodeles waltl]